MTPISLLLFRLIAFLSPSLEWKPREGRGLFFLTWCWSSVPSTMPGPWWMPSKSVSVEGTSERMQGYVIPQKLNIISEFLHWQIQQSCFMKRNVLYELSGNSSQTGQYGTEFRGTFLDHSTLVHVWISFLKNKMEEIWLVKERRWLGWEYSLCRLSSEKWAILLDY